MKKQLEVKKYTRIKSINEMDFSKLTKDDITQLSKAYSNLLGSTCKGIDTGGIIETGKGLDAT